MMTGRRLQREEYAKEEAADVYCEAGEHRAAVTLMQLQRGVGHTVSSVGCWPLAYLAVARPQDGCCDIC